MFASDVAALRIQGQAAIEVLFITTEAASGAAVYPRLQVRLEPQSELKLVERHLGAPARSTLVGANVNIALERGAQLSHYRLQQCGVHTLVSDTLNVTLAADAVYRARQVSVGAATARTSAAVQLNGRAAAVDWQAIAVGRGEQVHDVALEVEHLARETRTVEVFRGIAEESAQIAFSGHIRIDASAGGSDARQSLRGLIEGARAEIDLRPRLEINTDEVRAQHGATTGQLDENLLFYLLARGIEPATARALLKWAFLGDVLRVIELPALRSAAEQSAAGQLPDVVAIGALT
jgi:Fe-S cluster assembly protein SufD